MAADSSDDDAWAEALLHLPAKVLIFCLQIVVGAGRPETGRGG